VTEAEEREIIAPVIQAGRAMLDALGRRARPEVLFELEETFERAIAIAERRFGRFSDTTAAIADKD
jgi:hypothetical protein